MNISKTLLPVLAIAGTTLSSCIVATPYGPRVVAPVPAVGVGFGYWDAVPVGYVGESYFYGGHYYYGGRYETGRWFHNGVWHTSRYVHNGHTFYGGRRQVHGHR